MHAQDRFFEMDLRRHITAGRLSELVGKGGLETDKVIRTLGWRRVAEAELPTLKPETRQYLQAYADGVNAYLDSSGSPSRRGPRVRRARPAGPGPPRRAVDPRRLPRLAQGHGLGPAGRLRRRAGPRPALRPACPRPRSTSSTRPTPTAAPADPSAQDWSPQVECRAAVRGAGLRPSPRPCRACSDAAPAPAAQDAYAAVQHALARRPAAARPRRGHRLELVGRVGLREVDAPGKPLLANDPHLGVGHPRHLEPGQPALPLGRQRPARSTSAASPSRACRASSSATTADRLGLHQPRRPTSPTSTSSRSAAAPTCATASYVPLEQRQETIKIAGGADHTITVRSTVHGPILSEVLPTVAEAGGGRPPSGTARARATTTCPSPGPA